MNSRNIREKVTLIILLACRKFLPGAGRFSRLSLGALAGHGLFATLCVPVLLAPLLVAQQPDQAPAYPPAEPAAPQPPEFGVCHVGSAVHIPDSVSKTLNVPKYDGYRPRVTGDYIVIEYDAGQSLNDPYRGETSWSDYHRAFDPRGHNNTSNLIGLNGSFLPVIYNKEKIAVRVCGLHFTDVLTVTTSPNGVPESGADIRGATQVTPAASLSSTLDMLQSGSATGGTTTQPGLGLNATTAVQSLTLSGITPGTLGPEDQTPGKYPSYTPATVTASGKQVALLLYAMAANAKEVTRLIGRTEGDAYPAIMADATTRAEFMREAAQKAAKGQQGQRSRETHRDQWWE